MSTFTPFTPNPGPPPREPPPRMWKSMGVIAQDQAGTCEARYAIDSIFGDLDIDTESDLRAACQGLLHQLTKLPGPVDADAIYVLQVGKRYHRVRLSTTRWEDRVEEVFTEH